MAPAYRSPAAARDIVRAIVRPIRAAGAEQVLHSALFALAADSSTDRTANKQDFVYARTMSASRSHSAFLGLQDLQVGTAVAAVAACKHVMLRAGLPLDQWIGQVFWYCAEGATAMQSTGKRVLGPSNGVCGASRNNSDHAERTRI